MKIDGKEVVYHWTVLVLDGKLAEFSFTLDGWEVKIALRFDFAEGAGHSMKGEAQGDNYLVTCTNWTSPIGTASTLGFGTTPAGRKLFLDIWHEKLATNNRATLQITAEEPHAD